MKAVEVPLSARYRRAPQRAGASSATPARTPLVYLPPPLAWSAEFRLRWNWPHTLDAIRPIFAESRRVPWRAGHITVFSPVPPTPQRQPTEAPPSGELANARDGRCRATALTRSRRSIRDDPRRSALTCGSRRKVSPDSPSARLGVNSALLNAAGSEALSCYEQSTAASPGGDAVGSERDLSWTYGCQLLFDVFNLW